LHKQLIINNKTSVSNLIIHFKDFAL
jgi:hypothetical protein